MRVSCASDLGRIAGCHQAAFPESLSTKLGKRFVAKMLEWYLVTDGCFLVHLEKDGVVSGYCGGMVRRPTEVGSTSATIQYAMGQGVVSIAFRPWLIFHSELRRNPWLLAKNLFRRAARLFRRKSPAKNKSSSPTGGEDILIAGLIVIGVHPAYRGCGLGRSLLERFDSEAIARKATRANLSVRSHNTVAIAAYKKSGWKIQQQNEVAVSFAKSLE